MVLKYMLKCNLRTTDQTQLKRHPELHKAKQDTKRKQATTFGNNASKCQCQDCYCYCCVDPTHMLGIYANALLKRPSISTSILAAKHSYTPPPCTPPCNATCSTQDLFLSCASPHVPTPLKGVRRTHEGGRSIKR